VEYLKCDDEDSSKYNINTLRLMKMMMNKYGNEDGNAKDVVIEL
jgi:hypothetical protein